MVVGDIKTDVIMIAIMSFLGFCIENIWVYFRHSYVDNRNMYLPFLLGYGLLMNTIYHVIGTPNSFLQIFEIEYPINCIIYFSICFLIVSIGEFILGTFIEKTLGYEYWNYSQIPLHITKYTSIPTSFGFAFIMTIFMKNIYTSLYNFLQKVVVNIPITYIIIIAVALLVDFFVSFRNMYLNKGSNVIWRINFKKKHYLNKYIFNGNQ